MASFSGYIWYLRVVALWNFILYIAQFRTIAHALKLYIDLCRVPSGYHYGICKRNTVILRCKNSSIDAHARKRETTTRDSPSCSRAFCLIVSGAAEYCITLDTKHIRPWRNFISQNGPFASGRSWLFAHTKFTSRTSATILPAMDTSYIRVYFSHSVGKILYARKSQIYIYAVYI